MASSTQVVRVVPDGFSYRDEVVPSDLEAELLAFLDDIELDPFVMRGYSARRTVRSYGWSYSFESRQLKPADPLPDEIVRLRELAAPLAGVTADELEQALVTGYPRGATIGWHRDVPAFGPVVIGVSLRSACRLRMRRQLGGVRYVHDQILEPRSTYVLSGLARSAWEHSIPATEDLRFSVTFRTVRADRIAAE